MSSIGVLLSGLNTAAALAALAQASRSGASTSTALNTYLAGQPAVLEAV
jgi:hypothetical protein